MVCKLLLLGTPQLIGENRRPIPVPAKTYALVAYLVLAGRGAPVPRSALRQFLWENSDAKTAATNLRKFLSRVIERQEEHGYELIRSRRDHVELVTSSVDIDLTRLLEIIAGRSPSDIATLCELYRGDLLEQFEMSDSETIFGNWLHMERTKLRDAFINAVSRRIEPIEPDADRMQLRGAARRLIDVDPYNEAGHRTLMRLYAEDGEPARVRDTYLHLKKRLDEDLKVQPDAATYKLFQSLMPAREEQPATVEPTPRPAPAPAPTLLLPGVPSLETVEHQTEAASVPHRSGLPKVTILPPAPIAGQEYGHQLAASLIEDVTIGLCRSKALSIVAPHTALELSQDNKKTLFRTFGIDYAVETRLQNRGGELWLAVKLLNALTRGILWVEQYKFDPGQMAHQYQQLSTQIVLLLVNTIERTELSRYEVAQDPTAYHLFLAGQRFLRKLDLPHVRRARRAFKLAIGSSRDFVPAISGLAHTFHIEWLLMARGDSELLAEAAQLARRSLEIDPDDARGYRDLGLCNVYGGGFDESLEAFAQAERRNPQYADLLVDYADALQHACEPALALEKINAAIALNPLGPDRYWWTAGGANFHMRRYREAIEAMSHMHDPSPAYRLLAASWALLGERERASEYVRKATEIHPDFNVAGWLSILPIRDPVFAQHYEQGLREAGFK